MKIKKPRKSRQIKVGGLTIGGDAPVRVQSMCNTDTKDVEATLSQIERLTSAGCELVRVAVLNESVIEPLKKIRQKTDIPLIADIHFDYRLAIASFMAGADCVRINPGNIGGNNNLLKVARKAAEMNKAIRVGVNAGSLEKDLLKKYGRPSPEALVESALRSIEVLEESGFYNFKVSIKSSDVRENIESCLLFAEKSDAPLHVGVTEAGPLIPGIVKSSLGIGFVLAEGIGETIRVSLTRDPVEEVRVGYEILRALGLRKRGVEIISCPTCGRTDVDLFKLVEDVEEALRHIEEPVKVAVMGCVVNGPGEAKEADIGVAGGKKQGILFSRGEKIKKVDENKIVSSLVSEVEKFIKMKETNG